MTFMLSIPRSETKQEFEERAYLAKVAPKLDARTKTGKRQAHLVEAAREALIDMLADADPAPPYSGTIAGHVNDDLTGNVTITLNLLV